MTIRFEISVKGKDTPTVQWKKCETFDEGRKLLRQLYLRYGRENVKFRIVPKF